MNSRGKGEIEYLGTARDKVRYVPGDIIGTKTITVYDSTADAPAN